MYNETVNSIMQIRNKAAAWLAMGGIVVLFLMAFFTQLGRGEKVKQPIAFNHKKHIQNHVTCNVCHPNYKTHARAGIPGVKICTRCHEDVIYRTAEKDKIHEYYESGREIPWQRVYRVKSHTYFSHRRHTAIAKLNCIECHGDVANREEPIDQPIIKIEMAYCLSCHQKEKASVDCVDCHR